MTDYQRFLERRRDRAIAAILSFKDTNCNQHLPKDVSQGLRETILDEVNEFFNSICDRDWETSDSLS